MLLARLRFSRASLSFMDHNWQNVIIFGKGDNMIRYVMSRYDMRHYFLSRYVVFVTLRNLHMP